MTTKAIKTAVLNRKKLTKAQKLRVLKDAREMLSDRRNWTQGVWVQVVDGGGDITRTDDFCYVPSEGERTAMCVIGAVACAAGLQGEVSDPGAAMVMLGQCDIAQSMMCALPESDRVSEQDMYEQWLDSGEWYVEHGVFDPHPSITSFDSPNSAGDEFPTEEGFRQWLKAEGFHSPLAWYVTWTEGEALEAVYRTNDNSGDADAAYKSVLDLLDTAIANLEAQ